MFSAPAITEDCPPYDKEFNSAKDSFKIVANGISSRYFYSTVLDESCQFGLLPVFRGGKWGYYNLKLNKEINSCIFDSVGIFRAGETAEEDTLFFANVYYKGLEIILDREGYMVFNALDLIVYTKNGKKGLEYRSEDGSIKFTITPPLYESMSVEDLMSSTVGYGIFITKKEGKFGLVDVVGRELLPFEYDKIFVPDLEINNTYVAFIKKGKYTGICNKRGKIFVPPEYDKVNYYATTGITDDMAVRFAVAKGKKEGFYEVGKGLIFPCEFDEVFYIDHDGDGGYVLIARNGRYFGIYPAPGSSRKADEGYQNILPLVENIRLAMKNGKWGVLDARSEVVLPFIYEEIKFVDYKYYWVKEKGKWGSVDNKGNFIVQPLFDDVKGQMASLISAKQKKFWGLINDKGENKTAFVYERLSYNYERKLWLCQLGKREGLLDEAGQQYLAPEYDKIQEIYDDYIIAKKNAGFGAIDHKGKMIIDFKYSKIIPLNHGQFSANIKNNFGVIDSLGQTIIPFEFEDVYPIGSDHFVVQKEGLKGIYSNKGKQVIRIEFEKIIDFKEGVSKVVKQGKTIWVDIHGNEFKENPSKKKRRGKG